jgi:putative transposase
VENGCHLGMEKTFHKLAERYYWKGMSSELNTYIKTCHQCQHTNKNVKTTPAELQPIPIPKSTWKKIGIYLIGPYTDKHGKPLSTNGYRYVLTVIDFFSNYVEVFPLQRKEAAEVSDKIYELFCRHGVPLEVVSDNGGEFNAHLTESHKSPVWL